MPKAAPSNRAYEKVTFECGLIAIPLDVYSGTVSDHGIKRNQFRSIPVLDEDGNQKTVAVDREDGTTELVPVTEDHPIGYAMLDKDTGEIIDKSEIVKKIATEYGHVYVEDHEIEQLFDIPTKSLVVKEFQPQQLFYGGHYVPKSMYYVEVGKTTIGKRKVDNAKAQGNFALILAAMKQHNAMALVDFTTRGVPKPAILLPNGVLYVLYHTDELREQRPMPEVEVSKEVAEVAWKQYLEPFWGEKPVDLTDTRTELIQDFADKKAKAGDFGKPVEVEVVASAEPDATDLLATLQAAVEQAQERAEAV